MSKGFDAIGLGRALIYDPNLVNSLQNGSVRNSGCTACNQCVTLMYTPGGTACVEDGGYGGHKPELNTIPASQY
jgi:2,4-dienoyl-CoA reductase (NADPH2)